MSRSLLDDAFGHHTWATLRLIDACQALDPTQLQGPVPGTYGPILDTMRHLVSSDSWYLHRCSGARTQPISDEEEARMDLAAMRAAMERSAAGWTELLTGDLDPDARIDTIRDDGSETHAPLGIRLAQAIHHGTDHRSQICTALTSLGIEPPLIDVWDFGGDTGRVTEVPPSG
jgi:uncharacterized damage-inducible protein DinB